MGIPKFFLVVGDQITFSLAPKTVCLSRGGVTLLTGGQSRDWNNGPMKNIFVTYLFKKVGSRQRALAYNLAGPSGNNLTTAND